MQTLRITGRASKLSILQMQKVKHKILQYFPHLQIELLPKQSKGDLLQHVALQTVEGSDFFTQDIYDILEHHEADIAVHSLKDMSANHFLGSNYFAVVDRDDVRDVAMFNSNITDKLEKGLQIIVGTCSPRRELMAINFLQKALPQYNAAFTIITKDLRGNIDTRLQKLHSGEYDAIILATAGLNRLLANEYEVYTEAINNTNSIISLLKNKKLMLLPLIECVPAPCQGAIVAEALPSNTFAVQVLNAIKDSLQHSNCIEEKLLAKNYGSGCLQKFGVTTINYTKDKKVIYAAGINDKSETFSYWQGLPPLNNTTAFFSSTDYMGQFFSYEYCTEPTELEQPHIYVANYKAVNPLVKIQLADKHVWAAGTKTWYELAKQNIWVSGCADAFGLEFLEQAWQMPLFKLTKQDVGILTNEQSAEIWQHKGWNVVATYKLLHRKSNLLEKKISTAEAIFWTSFQQYEQYKSFVQKNVQHYCSSGETAVLLQKAGLQPVVFPNIKSFTQCLSSNIP